MRHLPGKETEETVRVGDLTVFYFLRFDKSSKRFYNKTPYEKINHVDFLT